MVNTTEPRVRFAPSPTGTLHVGGARTALFNWLFAKAVGGTFILRIEDTDRTRYDEKAEAGLIKDLEWLGLHWAEGEGTGGDCGPYRQSQRKEIYLQHARELVSGGNAYPCFCSGERIAKIKEQQQKEKKPIGYDRHCRDLPPEEAQRKMHKGEPHVIRLKIPLTGETRFRDFLRGDIVYQNGELDDLVLLKSDGFPAYHLASVVDDHLMQISHVLRGEEWIPSTPKHVLIYRSFGWEPPTFVHLPVILAEGGGKLSKRKGAASVGDFRDLGYLPETLINFLALLGWNPGGDRELMNREELGALFTLEKINPKACFFDTKKLEWMNGQYLMRKAPEELLPLVEPFWTKEDLHPENFSREYLLGVVGLMRERVRLLPDFATGGRYYFLDPESYDPKGVKKHFGEGAGERLRALLTGLEAGSDFTQESIEAVFKKVMADLQVESLGKLIHPARLAVSGVTFGPGLYDLLALLGRETVRRRLSQAIQYLNPS